MGINFYVRGMRHSADPEHHIGKRSASGYYCWDCKVTLCKDGEDAIHYGRSAWYETCPKCGAKKADEKGWVNSVGRELGFNDTEPQAKKGVRTCASFTWAMTKPQWMSFCEVGLADKCPHCNREYDDPDKVIEDEYGRTYTWKEFEAVLAECPIQYNDSRGEYFS